MVLTRLMIDLKKKMKYINDIDVFDKFKVVFDDTAMTRDSAVMYKFNIIGGNSSDDGVNENERLIKSLNELVYDSFQVIFDYIVGDTVVREYRTYKVDTPLDENPMEIPDYHTSCYETFKKDIHNLMDTCGLYAVLTSNCETRESDVRTIHETFLLEESSYSIDSASEDFLRRFLKDSGIDNFYTKRSLVSFKHHRTDDRETTMPHRANMRYWLFGEVYL